MSSLRLLRPLRLLRALRPPKTSDIRGLYECPQFLQIRLNNNRGVFVCASAGVRACPTAW